MKMLIDNAKTTTGFSAIALSGVLLGGGLLGISGDASAIAASEPGPPWEPLSSVSDSVLDNNDGTWTYSFTVNNNSANTANAYGDAEPLIVDWEIPYFSDAGIASITSPTGWDYAIETIGTPNWSTGWDGTATWQDPSDPFYFGANSPFTTATQVLHWYNTCWAEAQGECLDGAIYPWLTSAIDVTVGELSGFGFTADYDPANGPYQASWDFLEVISGDPQLPFGGIPASPTVTGQQQPSVPEPATLALFGLGLAGLGFSRRRRQK